MAGGQPTPEISWSQTRFAGDGLRTRFRPSSRIRPFFLSVVPWLDALLLVVCFYLASQETSVYPGIRADLPTATFREGSESDFVIVMNPPSDEDAAEGIAPAGDDARHGAIVFFDGLRFNFSRPEQKARFVAAIRDHLADRDHATDAILVVDRDLPYGDLVDMLETLRENHVPHVNFATKAR